MMDQSTKRARGTTLIPKIRLDIEQIATRAETMPHAFVYDSTLRSTYLMRRQNEILIITGNKGYLRIKKDDVPALVEELQNIKEDMEGHR